MEQCKPRHGSHSVRSRAHYFNTTFVRCANIVLSAGHAVHAVFVATVSGRRRLRRRRQRAGSVSVIGRPRTATTYLTVPPAKGVPAPVTDAFRPTQRWNVPFRPRLPNPFTYHQRRRRGEHHDDHHRATVTTLPPWSYVSM